MDKLGTALRAASLCPQLAHPSPAPTLIKKIQKQPNSRFEHAHAQVMDDPTGRFASPTTCTQARTLPLLTTVAGGPQGPKARQRGAQPQGGRLRERSEDGGDGVPRAEGGRAQRAHGVPPWGDFYLNASVSALLYECVLRTEREGKPANPSPA